VIVLDSSAVVAIWQHEPDADDLIACILQESDTERCLSAATYLEAGTVLAARRIRDLSRWPAQFDDWIKEYAIDLIPVDAEQARLALEARIRYGRGFGSGAKLNYGDCFSYALAKTLKAPLLYVGDDFDKTDVKSALRRKKR
jgi:ribonuclease VapC